MNFQMAFSVALIFCVSAPIAGDDIQLAIGVKIAHRNGIPFSNVIGKVQFRGDFSERVVLSFENANWTPFASENEFRSGVAGNVAPHSAVDEADVRKFLREAKRFSVV